MAVYNKTYFNLINTIRNIGKQHKFIHTTTVGDIYDIDLSKETLFPLMHINPVNVSTGYASLTYSFQIFVCDLVSEKEDWKEQFIHPPFLPNPFPNLPFQDLTNEIDVFNDTLQTCVDIVSIFRNSKWQSVGSLDINNQDYVTEGEYTFEPFTERFDNLLTGWVFTLDVTVHNEFQTCNIPMADKVIAQ
tara:strand:- start:462 stop:1028 length:567 start_codon:yes stop_codon:yes gene_type:complete